MVWGPRTGEVVTGILNKRHFEARLLEEFKGCAVLCSFILPKYIKKKEGGGRKLGGGLMVG